MEAIGKRHIIVFIWMLYRDRGTIRAECFFFSYCTDWSGMWERTSFSHGEFCTTKCVFWILDAQEPWALDEQLKHFADMLTHIPTVDSGIKYSQQVQDSSLQIHNNPNVLRSSWYSCMIMDGTLSSQNSTLSKKVMSHCWCHFHRWETLDFSLNLLQRRLICPVHVLAWEKWFWGQPSVLISFSIYKM